MQFHFANLLDQDYFTMCPNRERWAYVLPEAGDLSETKIATIGAKIEYSERILECENLEELTLHEPSAQQISQITKCDKFSRLKRLRISFARVKDIEFIANFSELNELVLEYVSGFSDLSPLASLPNLTALHFENLRRVSDFSPLGRCKNLRYFCINGTLDWSQPIDNLEFVRDMRDLEALWLSLVRCDADFPVFASFLDAKNLKRIRIHPGSFSAQDFAFLAVALAYVQGSQMPLEVVFDDGHVSFLGKKSGYTHLSHKTSDVKRAEFAHKFERYKAEAASLLASKI